MEDDSVWTIDLDAQTESPPRQRQRLNTAGQRNPKPKVQQKLNFRKFLVLRGRSCAEYNGLLLTRLLSLLSPQVSCGATGDLGPGTSTSGASPGAVLSLPRPRQLRL